MYGISSLRTSLKLFQRNNALNYRALHACYPTKSKKDNGDDKERKSSINSLFDNMEESENDENNLESLMKNIKDKNQKRRKLMSEGMKKFEELSNKRGEEFWFPESIPKTENFKQLKINKEVEPEEKITKVLAELPQKQEVTKVTKKPIEIKKLKKQIEEEGTSRSVSKLMSALIDNIDQDASETEQNFKKLLTAFSKSDNSSSRDAPIRYEGRNIRRSRKSGTHFHESTNLFGNYEKHTLQEESSSYISLSEKKWREDLQTLLPEVIPENAFEVKMLDIDRQWQFPIDNDQDMGIEDKTSFEEHVFLDHLLDEFPEDGPIRKFMELVVTGLQQNPYISVEEKTNRILWFQDYFERFPEEDLTVASV